MAVPAARTPPDAGTELATDDVRRLEGQERTNHARRDLGDRHAFHHHPKHSTITRRLVTLADAADALAVSTRTVRRYIADGHLEAVRLSRKTLRIKAESDARFIDAKPVGNWRR